MVGIVTWGSYIPKYRIKAEDIAKAWGSNPEQIKSGLMITEKSLPGIDEDTITIAVEAARNAVRAARIDPKSIGAVYIGSESHPYAVKPTGTVVAEALNMGNKYTTADFEFACKAGTAAIQVSMAMVRSGMAEYALAGGCDTAQASPGDPLEYTAAAGGAVFLIGLENVSAEINHTVSYTSDTPDFWRKKYEKYPAHGGAFTGQPAYYRHVIAATSMLMEKANTSSADYDYAIFHQPNGKFPTRVAKILGFKKEQIQPGLVVSKIGNTYSGSSILGLCAVLDIAKPGDRILLTSYGSGAGSDSFDITVTDKIFYAREKNRTVESYIQDKIYVDYTKYLKNTGNLR
ncbi:hydroxymethylglutaryl-CoA synthase [Candidatus Woesearchaeota archaeon]|nr:hydroxymethylglutaryl-CoA synthase [Candidatus Woesearchaeota archaeon]